MSQRLAPWPFVAALRANESAARRADELDTAPRRPNLRVIEGARQARLERLSPRGRVILLLVTISIALFGVVAFHVKLSQGEFALTAMNDKANQAQADYERMRLSVSQLESPNRIATEAKNRLGLVPSEQVTAVTPTAPDMPKGLTVTPNAGSTAQDDAGWSAIKPQLSPSAP